MTTQSYLSIALLLALVLGCAVSATVDSDLLARIEFGAFGLGLVCDRAPRSPPEARRSKWSRRTA